MNKFYKNFIAVVASLSMCIIGFGVSTVYAEPNRTLSMKLMGVGSAPDPSSSVKRLQSEHNEFWIGVTADNLDDSIADHELFTNGVHTLEIAFEYDTTYILPFTEGSDTEGSWNAALVAGNLKNGVATDDAEWWDSTSYTITSSLSSDVNASPYRKGYPDETNIRAAAGSTWKMCTVQIRYNGSDFSKARFKGLTGDTAEKILIKVPFKLVTTPPDGTTVYPLAIVRGPETFAMGASENGFTPHYEWYADSTFRTDENLKLLFDDKTDNLNLFGVGGSITNIEYNEVLPTPEPTSTPMPDASPKPLSKTYSPSMGNEGYDAEAYGTENPYYITVPYDSESITLRIEAAGEPTVTLDDGGSGTNVGIASSVSQVHTTNEIALTPLNPETKDTDNGFLNKVTVTDGSRDYVIYIRRLIKPKIILNYGNSPYGEIMKADNIPDENKDEAKEAFNAGNIYKTWIPTAAAKKIRDRNTTPLKFNTNISTYPYRAWVDIPSLTSATPQELEDLNNPDINMDRNDYTIFIYNEKYFVDPGFKAINSMGEDVANVDRSITVQRMNVKNDNGIYDGNYTEKMIKIENQPSNYLVTEITKPYVNDSNSWLIRPDKYVMTYSYLDEYTGEITTQDRYVVVLQRRGDTNFSNTVNLQDLNKIYQYFNKQSTYFKTSGSSRVITGTARTIYVYRCLDILSTNTINLQDLNPIYQYFNKYQSLTTDAKALNNNPLEEWYVELPDSL